MAAAAPQGRSYSRLGRDEARGAVEEEDGSSPRPPGSVLRPSSAWGGGQRMKTGALALATALAALAGLAGLLRLRGAGGSAAAEGPAEGAQQLYAGMYRYRIKQTTYCVDGDEIVRPMHGVGPTQCHAECDQHPQCTAFQIRGESCILLSSCGKTASSSMGTFIAFKTPGGAGAAAAVHVHSSTAAAHHRLRGPSLDGVGFPAQGVEPHWPSQQKPYDCDAGYTNWEQGWSEQKQAWCCEYTGKACKGTRYDCEAGYANWERGWSQPKQAWCCEHAGKGCRPDIPDHAHEPEPFDCMADVEHWASMWPPEKKDWCCNNFFNGCSTHMHAHVHSGHHVHAVHVTHVTHVHVHGEVGAEEEAEEEAPPPSKTKTFDCQAGQASWTGGWSLEKKAYCLEKHYKVCPFTPDLQDPIYSSTNGTFDCNVGLAQWQTAWSKPQRAWCCRYFSPPPDGEVFGPHDCSKDVIDWETHWSESKQGWCCTHYDLGCVAHKHHGHAHSPPAKYDCQIGILNWEKKWMPAKRVYCCNHISVGCPFEGMESPLHGNVTNCTVGPEGTGHWPASKLMWCCKNRGIGCHSAPRNDPAVAYDCKADYANWQSWADAKKTWCCKHKGKACVLKAPEAGTHYDCVAGFANWQHGWSAGKQAWCCQHTGRACTGGAKKEYDCDAGFENWQRGWSAGKKAWCCEHAGRACDGVATPYANPGEDPFDCDKQSIHRWTPLEHEWCCRERRTGCEGLHPAVHHAAYTSEDEDEQEPVHDAPSGGILSWFRRFQ